MAIKLAPDAFDFPEIAEPASPPATYLRVYNDVADSTMKAKDSAGVVTPFGGGAPTDATYITQTANGMLSNEQALSSLATGIVTVTTATGVLSSVAAPSGAVVGTTDAQTLGSKILSQLHLIIGGFKAIFTHAFSADRTITLPGDANVTLVGADTIQNISNKTFTDQVLIAGSADEVQFRVQGFTGSFADLADFEDASGNVVARIDSRGGMVLNENSDSPSHALRVESNTDANAFVVGGADGAIGIGVDPPDVSSSDLIVDIVSTLGFLGVPAMDSADMSGLNPRGGAIAFDTDLQRFIGQADGTKRELAFTGADGIPFQDPSLQSWTALNQASGMYNVDTTNKRVTVRCAGTATVQLRGWYVTVTPPYNFVFRVKFFNSNVDFNGVVFGFRENATGELHTFEQRQNGNAPQYIVRKWNSATSINSNYIAGTAVTLHMNWIRLVDNNTSAREIDISEDGTHWQTIHSISRTDFLTADELFFGLTLGGVSSDDAQATLLSMEDVS